AVLGTAGGQMGAATGTGQITDADSGVDPAGASYAVVGSYGTIQPSGSVTVSADGSYSFTIQLQALRNGNDKNGRTYTVTVSANDSAGNSVCASTTVLVPHN